MPKKYSKRVSSDVKMEALKKHMVKQVPISEICEELGVQPTAFYFSREMRKASQRKGVFERD